MNICKKCGDKIPWRINVNGKYRQLNGRKFCVNCSPFGCNNRKDLNVSDEDRIIRRRKQNRDRQKKYVANVGMIDIQQQLRRNRKEQLVTIFGGKCQKCGYDKCISCLQFHHKNPKEKKFTIASNLLRNWDILLQEAKKCILLCGNCHCEKHMELECDGSTLR